MISKLEPIQYLILSATHVFDHICDEASQYLLQSEIILFWKLVIDFSEDKIPISGFSN